MTTVPYRRPNLRSSSFNCPHCHAYAMQGKAGVHFNGMGIEGFMLTRCQHCSNMAIWRLGEMIYPSALWAPPPHSAMPTECVAEYEEARSVLAASPRAAAALLRLTIQKLMVHLGQDGKNINDDVRALVKDGLPTTIQQALDVCRITGNEAVHPGQMDLNVTPDIAEALFGLVNHIIENRIAEPDRIRELYLRLPGDKRKAVDIRDGRGDREE